MKIFLQKEENWIFAGPWHQHQRPEGLSIWFSEGKYMKTDFSEGKYMKQIWLPMKFIHIKLHSEKIKSTEIE